MNRRDQQVQKEWEHDDPDTRMPVPPTSEHWEKWMEKMVASPEYIAAEILYVVDRNLGYGEEGSNNRGRFISAIGGKQGAEWCATVAGYCYEKGHERAHVPMPFERDPGAKRLVKNLAAVGSRFTDIERAARGDLTGFHRRSGSVMEAVRSWKGHVGILVDKRPLSGGRWWAEVAEGNVGGYPAEYQTFEYEIDIDGVWWRLDRKGKTRCRFWTFATLRKGLA
jgi:hypothetical protein